MDFSLVRSTLRTSGLYSVASWLISSEEICNSRGGATLFVTFEVAEAGEVAKLAGRRADVRVIATGCDRVGMARDVE